MWFCKRIRHRIHITSTHLYVQVLKNQCKTIFSHPHKLLEVLLDHIRRCRTTCCSHQLQPVELKHFPLSLVQNTLKIHFNSTPCRRQKEAPNHHIQALYKHSKTTYHRLQPPHRHRFPLYINKNHSPKNHNMRSRSHLWVWRGAVGMMPFCYTCRPLFSLRFIQICTVCDRHSSEHGRQP